MVLESARYENGRPVFKERVLREVLQANQRLIDTRAPDAQLWFLGQAFAQGKELRIPTPQEMEQLYTIAEQERVNGFLWYPWHYSVYDHVLSDAEMEAEQKTVHRVFDKHILKTPTPWMIRYF
jgi:hypothetical protein